jgi:hypothetical protein
MGEKTIETVVADIVELSLKRDTGDPKRDIYTVLMDLSLKISGLFREIWEQEKQKNNLDSGSGPE